MALEERDDPDSLAETSVTRWLEPPSFVEETLACRDWVRIRRATSIAR